MTNLFKRILAAIIKAKQTQADRIILQMRCSQAYRELLRMDERELADIGIHRNDIKRIAYDKNFNR